MRISLLTFVFLLVFTSCEKNDHQNFKECPDDIFSEFHQKRNPDIPTINYEKYAFKPSIIQNNMDDLRFIGWLGRSVRLNTLPIESMENLYFPIIDIQRYYQDYPTSIVTDGVISPTYSIHAFSSFNKYYEKTNTSSTINASLDLGIGENIFNFNASASFLESFNITNTNISEYVFGSLKIHILKNKYSLNLAGNNLSRIMDGYLNSTFIDNIYFSTPQNLISNYGSFVTKDMITGGVLEILYTAKKQTNTSSTESSEELEIALETEILGMISGDASLTVTESEENSDEKTFSDLYITYKYSGGNATLGDLTSQEEDDRFNFDTSPWEESMIDPTNYVISKYPENSLEPIYTFIEEDNLKLKYENLLTNRGTALQSLEIPKIKITVIDHPMQKNMKLCESFIYTRFGDKILLNSISLENNSTAIRNIVGSEFQRLQNIYPDIEIVSYNNYQTGRLNNNLIWFEGCAFNPNSLTKFVDSNTGKTYLLTTIQSTGKKVAYVLYNQDIIDEYTFGDIVDQLPTTTNSLHIIKTQYELIAL